MTHDCRLASSSGRTALPEPALTYDSFSQTLEALNSVLPFAKAINPQAWLLLWGTFPQHAKEHVTPAMWSYAAGQRLMDPEPAKELAIHLQLLRYLYRLENGIPNFTWGLKLDLSQRMSHAGCFYPEPRSLADQVAAEGSPRLDGNRHEPTGVLANIDFNVLP
jgi:hypothetical protein